jgi:hypothetical protein
MTVASAPQAIAAKLITHIRRKLNDPTHNPNGVPNRILGYQEWEIFEELNNTLKYLWNLANVSSVDDALNYVDITYNEANAGEGSLLPSSLDGDVIFAVHDEANKPPVILSRDSIDGISKLDVLADGLVGVSTAPNIQRYAIRPVAATNYIVIRPRPNQGRVYRVHYVVAPLQVDDTTDFVPFSIRFDNLIVLHTFLQLTKRPIEDLRESVMQRDNEMAMFRRWATTARGPRRVTNARKGPRY